MFIYCHICYKETPSFCMCNRCRKKICDRCTQSIIDASIDTGKDVLCPYCRHDYIIGVEYDLYVDVIWNDVIWNDVIWNVTDSVKSFNEYKEYYIDYVLVHPKYYKRILCEPPRIKNKNKNKNKMKRLKRVKNKFRNFK